MCKVDHSRRSFLRTASLTSMAGFYASPFLIGLNSLAAMAQGSGLSDYRALVCVFLQGGNDGHGTVMRRTQRRSARSRRRGREHRDWLIR